MRDTCEENFHFKVRVSKVESIEQRWYAIAEETKESGKEV